MTIIFNIIVFLLLQQTNNQYPLNKKHQPSSKGIELYVDKNANKIISEFQHMVQDTLYDVYVYSSNLGSANNDSLILGVFYPPNEIIITSEEKFIAYEIKDISRYRKNSYKKNNNFVKATLIHELMHYYFNQVIREMHINNQTVSIEFNNFSIIPRVNYVIGEKFIEEGISEYAVVKAGESIFPEDFYIPKTYDEFNKKNDQLFYEYSVEYVRSFVDYYGFKKAIQKIVSIKPPTNEEILYPAKYFSKFQEN